MKQILQNLSSGETLLAEVPAPKVRPGHLLIETEASLVSLGTERMLIDFGKASLLQKALQQPERVKQVIQKIKVDGLGPTLEVVRSKLDTPLPLGYCNVGRVVEVGAGVESFAVGDRVLSNRSHAEVVCAPKNLCAKVPEGVTPVEAAFGVVGAIGLQGIRLLQPTLGETMVVTGLGLIGQLAVQLLQAHGCRVIGIDMDPVKCALARDCGAEVIDLSQGVDPVKAAENLTGGRGVDGVLLTAATKSDEPVHQAAAMCRQRGRIVLVGVVGLKLNRADFYEKELSFQVSCAYGPGRYDPQYEEKGQDYPFGFVRWTEQRNFEAVLQLLATGKLRVEPLISHRFPFDRALEAYQQVGGGGTMGIVLEYGAESGERRAEGGEEAGVGNRSSVVGDQPTTENQQPATQASGFRSQPSAISDQPSAISDQASVLGTQSSVLGTQSSVISHQVSAISHPSSAIKKWNRVVEVSPRDATKSEDAVVGIIGAGSFTGLVILPALKATPARLKAISSGEGVSASHLARKFSIEQAVTDNEAIFNDPEINTIFITTRHRNHGALVQRALEAGKHVFVEKPLCIEPGELGEIRKFFQNGVERRAASGPEGPTPRREGVEQEEGGERGETGNRSSVIGARSSVVGNSPTTENQQPTTPPAGFRSQVSGLRSQVSSISHRPQGVLMVGFNRRFAPLLLRMRELVADRTFPLSMVFQVNAGVVPPDHWSQSLEEGGGRVIGEACHFIDTLRFLAGAPITGGTSTYAAKEGVRVGDVVTIQLSFADGSIGTVHYFGNGNKEVPREQLDVYGNGGILRMDNFRRLTGYQWPGFRKQKLRRQDKGHRAEVAAFIEAIRTGQPSPIPPEELFEVTEATFTAARA